mgnify:CR=1 FL=1
MANEEKSFTRRYALQMAGIAGIGAMLAGCSTNSGSSANSGTDSTKQKGTSLSVYDPTGSIEIVNLHAPRLDTLDGKTIAFIADDAWEDDRTFPEFGRLFAEKYPNTKIMTQDNFIHGIDALTMEKNGVPEQLQAAHVDAAIVGNAG